MLFKISFRRAGFEELFAPFQGERSRFDSKIFENDLTLPIWDDQIPNSERRRGDSPSRTRGC